MKTKYCAVCMKFSDASLSVLGAELCGTHYDSWMRSPERASQNKMRQVMRFADWVMRISAEERNGSRETNHD
jgi:hypothetical protein